MNQSSSTLPLERVHPRARGTLRWAVGVGVTLLLLVPKLFQHAAAHTGDLDTGNYSHFAWSIAHGESLVALHGRHHLAEHFSPVMFLVAPLYRLAASAYWLMALQALSVAAAVLLTLKFAADRLAERGLAGPSPLRPDDRLLLCGTLLVLLLLYPPLLATWGTQFQPVELGMPMVVAAIAMLHGRGEGREERGEGVGARGEIADARGAVRIDDAAASVPAAAAAARGARPSSSPLAPPPSPLFWLLILLLLTTRESAPLSVLGIAIYAGLLQRRWKLAAALVIVAGVWAGVTIGWVMPHFRGEGRWQHLRWLEPPEGTDAGQFAMMRVRYALVLFGGLGLLSLTGRAALVASLAAVPGAVLNLVTYRDTQLTFQGHYDAQTAAFTMVAAAHGVAWLAEKVRRGRTEGEGGARTGGAAFLWLGVAAAVAIAATAFGFSRQRTPVQALIDWWPTPERLEYARTARELGAKYASAPYLAAWNNIGPQVCHRPGYRTIRVTKEPFDWEKWASLRLMPGTVMLVPSEAAQPSFARTGIAASGHAVLVETAGPIEVWRWPADAPAAGTPEAMEYVVDGSGADRLDSAVWKELLSPEAYEQREQERERRKQAAAAKAAKEAKEAKEAREAREARELREAKEAREAARAARLAREVREARETRAWARVELAATHAADLASQGGAAVCVVAAAAPAPVAAQELLHAAAPGLRRLFPAAAADDDKDDATTQPSTQPTTNPAGGNDR
jgi:uncharacterized membrane protein